MTHTGIALWAEFMKIRHSKITWITVLLFAFIPGMLGFMIYIVRHPDISAKLGLLAAKASFFSFVNWKAFFGIMNQFIASTGLIGFGFVTAWVFGREYTDRTIKDILVLPVSRGRIVLAKCLLIFLWCTLLMVVFLAAGLVIGWMSGLSGWSQPVLEDELRRYFALTFMTLLLSTPVAFFASYGRGLIAPLGFVLFTMITAQFATMAGLGSFFPWSIPGQVIFPGSSSGMNLPAAGCIILCMTSILGYAATLMWWCRADQH